MSPEELETSKAVDRLGYAMLLVTLSVAAVLHQCLALYFTHVIKPSVTQSASGKGGE